MNQRASYKKGFYQALSLHLILVLALVIEPFFQSSSFVTENNPQKQKLSLEKKEPETIQAESIDSKALEETVQRLKAEKEKTRLAEVNRQRALAREAARAKQQRIQEQKRLKQLQQEADRIATERKRNQQEEEKRLKQLALQKAKETKALEALKQQQEQLKLEQESARKKQEEAARLARQKAEKEKLEQALAERARQEAVEQQQIAGEVDKYKALILNAISRQWSFPENTDNQLFSKFRIRLAPDGMVLEVRLIRSSGDPVLDRSAQTAIYKASPLPVPKEPKAFEFFRDNIITVRPERYRG